MNLVAEQLLSRYEITSVTIRPWHKASAAGSWAVPFPLLPPPPLLHLTSWLPVPDP